MNLLREHAFARLWAASLLAETAEWMLQVALPVFIFQVTGSAASTAFTMVAGLVPMVVFSPLTGVLADRWDRRVVLCGVAFGQALVSLPLLAVGRTGTLTVVFVVIVVYLSLLATAGTLLVARFGVGGKALSERPPWRGWLDGFADIRRDRHLRVVWSALMPMSAGQGMFVVLFVVFVTRTLGGGDAEVGLLRGVQAVGGMAAGLTLAWLARRTSPAKLLGWGALAFGALAAIIWNSPFVTTSFGLYLALFVVVGAPIVILNAGLMSVVQLATPPERTGRAMASLFAGTALFEVAGMVGAGAVAASTGPAVLLNAQAVFGVAAGLIVLFGLRPRGGYR